MKTKIIEVQSKKELKQFTHLPAQIYKNDHIWVNSVSLIYKKLFKSISHNNYKLFLALKDNKPAGRIAAFTDDNYDKKWTQERIGFWGSFESIKDYDVAEQLFESARMFIEKQKRAMMRGPVNFISQSMGFLIDNYYSPPVIISTYNPSYYVGFAEKYGFTVEKVLNSIILDGRWGYEIPERIENRFENIRQKYGIKLRFVKSKNIKKEIAAIVDIVNRSYSNYWGFAPVIDDEGLVQDAHDAFSRLFTYHISIIRKCGDEDDGRQTLARVVRGCIADSELLLQKLVEGHATGARHSAVECNQIETVFEEGS